MEPENRIKQLEAEVAELKAQLASATGPKREKIQTMSSEVKDTNPYSRLMGPWITNDFFGITRVGTEVAGAYLWTTKNSPRYTCNCIPSFMFGCNVVLSK